MKDLEPLWPSDRFAYAASHDAYFGATTDGLSYLVSQELLEQEPQVLERYRLQITEYLKANRGALNTLITTETIDEIRNFPIPSITERLIRLIRTIYRVSNGTTDRYYLQDQNDGIKIYEIIREIGVPGRTDLQSLLLHLQDRNLIEAEVGFDWIATTLTVNGLLYIETLEEERRESKSCFVAMWFSNEMNDAYSEGIVPAIAECGYDAVRIDAKEHNNKIDDEIIAEIRRAKFVVADFSCGPDGARGGVYFEAGLAIGLNIPVIFCVRNDDLSRVHFDTRQFSHIVWNDVSDFKAKLRNRILATIV